MAVSRRILVDVMPFDQGRSGLSVYAMNVVKALERAEKAMDLLVKEGKEETEALELAIEGE